MPATRPAQSTPASQALLAAPGAGPAVPALPEAIPAVPAALPLVPPAPMLRWRRVFPGQQAELRRVRGWLGELLPSGPAREDVVTVAIELAANAVRHTASGAGQGFFAVELTSQLPPVTVRVAVADGGARGAPHLTPGTDPLGPGPLGIESPSIGPLSTGALTAEQLGSDQLSEHGRGLRVVRALAERTGMCGDHRGRLVWAEIRWNAEGAAEPEFPDGYEASLRDIQAVMAARYPEADIWFGRTTMQWWAMIGRPEKGHPEARRLLTAESPADLAQLLDVARATAPPPRGRSRGRHGLTGLRSGPRPGLRSARPAGQQAWAGVRTALAPPQRLQPRLQPVTRAVRARFEGR
ncbi:MAG TPA: ATP-binding protein [Streptosporangiaceae bacterium]